MDTKNNTILVFDLDDTLYKEIDFLKSAYNEIAIFLSKITKISFELLFENMVAFYKCDLNAFKEIIHKYGIKEVSVDCLITMYRNHKPQIYLKDDIKNWLITIKKNVYKVGLITDGRCVQQQNKIEALGLTNYFDAVIISEAFGTEKPNLKNFSYFEETFGKKLHYIYVGDNTHKDFIAPNILGWQTICLLDEGENIHKQSFEGDLLQQPKHIIKSLSEISSLLLK
jgi:putative hydrolase of the HAD superfamily